MLKTLILISSNIFFLALSTYEAYFDLSQHLC